MTGSARAVLGRARAAARLAGFAGATAGFGLLLVAGERRGPGQPARRGEITRRWGRAVCRLTGLEVEVRGPVPRGAALWLANHRSYADIPALASVAPVTFVAKSEVAGWPLLGWAARRAGTVFLDRGSSGSGAAALRRLARLARGGTTAVVFPEGTTVAPPGIGPLQPGPFRLAAAFGLAVAPVAIEYARAGDAWIEPGDRSFVPHFLRCFGRARIPVRLAFGPVLRGSDPVALERAAEAWILAHLETPGEAPDRAAPRPARARPA